MCEKHSYFILLYLPESLFLLAGAPRLKHNRAHTSFWFTFIWLSFGRSLEIAKICSINQFAEYGLLLDVVLLPQQLVI